MTLLNIYAYIWYKHCWKDLYLILNTWVRIITKIMEDSLSHSQQDQHHYFIHLWACRCIDARQIIFLINQRSTLDITPKPKRSSLQPKAQWWHRRWQQRGHHLTHGSMSPACCMQRPLYIRYPIKQEKNAVKTEKRSRFSNMPPSSPPTREERTDRWWPSPWHITGLCGWMGQWCRWQRKN